LRVRLGKLEVFFDNLRDEAGLARRRRAPAVIAIGRTHIDVTELQSPDAVATLLAPGAPHHRAGATGLIAVQSEFDE